MTRDALLELIAQQQRSGFPDLSGTEGQGTIRVTDQLLTRIASMEVQRSRAIKDAQVRAVGGDRLQVRITVAKPSFLPPFTIRVIIERQPSLPDDPVLVLKLEGGGGLMRLAGPAAAFLDVLPPGVRMHGDRVHVDVRAVLEARGLALVLQHVDELRVHADEGAVRLAFRARLR